jgi:twitching motility protein PilI
MNEEAQTDPYALLLALDAEARDNQLVSDAADEYRQTNSYLSFSVCSKGVLLPIGEIIELVSTPSIVEIPIMQPWMRGIANIRGSLLPLTDLEGFFCEKRQSLGANSRVLIIEKGSSRYGLLVPEVYGIKEIAPEKLREIQPDAGNPLSGFCTLHASSGGKEWYLLDFDSLIGDERFMEVAA